MPDNNLYEPDRLPMPIASQGNYAVVPEQQAVAGDGKASIALGFGPENSRTLDEGGKAVRRQDLNGLFNRLSQMLYWVQSGGQWTYSTEKNYEVNCMVIYDNQFYICISANGPDFTAGVQTPSTATSYWITLSKFGDFVTSGSTIDNLQLAVDGLSASFNLTASTQNSITSSGGKGVFSLNTFDVTSSGISAGTYQIKDILQRLINNSHRHSSKSVSGDGSGQIYCSYCSYCSYCCRDCCDDCGDDGMY